MSDPAPVPLSLLRDLDHHDVVLVQCHLDEKLPGNATGAGLEHGLPRVHQGDHDLIAGTIPQLISEGNSNQDIAEIMHISARTVESTVTTR